MRFYLFLLFFLGMCARPLQADDTNVGQAASHLQFLEQMREIEHSLMPYTLWPQQAEYLLCLEPLQQTQGFGQLVALANGAEHECEAASQIARRLSQNIARSMQTSQISLLKDCAVGTAQMVVSPAIALGTLSCDVGTVIQAGVAAPLCAVALNGLCRAYTAADLFAQYGEIQDQLREHELLLVPLQN